MTTPLHTTTPLQTFGLTKNFGGLCVTNHVDFSLEAGARHALIGPNGAGKTTFVNLLTGVIPPTQGSIHLDGNDITHLSPRQRVKRGLARTFQINSLFPQLTTAENVALAIGERKGSAGRMFSRVERDSELEHETAALLEDLNILDMASKKIADLAYGQRRMVEIAIALAIRPQVLLLDEPAAGVPASESHAIIEMLERLPAHIAILLIEHDMDLVFRFARRITVLVEGSILIEGDGAQVKSDPRVKEIYLGRRHG
ncbi:MAG TPA: ABC transporter ATP-binding protein [Eoetvoesiella sp.]|uniref:ABC transporter ATP-binding protein n=1 Tax=Eoetvoesiella sp. TaxID=1966355 RepID=UPI002BDC06A8|nr:ABC transporter ATP-binding protein [Eoetvoesiella sp.]HWK60810.1 ABC transporter ATP-binding protein [Eoetvoesiella sp.]